MIALTHPTTHASRSIVTDLESLEALRPEWEALLARSRTNEPTLSPTWMLTWWRIFGRDGERSLRTIVFRDDAGRLIGLAPLLSRRATHRKIPFRRLELLASGEAEADETCSEYLSVLAAPEREREVAASFADAIVREELVGPWNELVLPAMSKDGVFPSLLASALVARGLDVELRDGPVSPFVPLPKTWDEYLRALSPEHRYRVRKSLRDFEAWAGAAPSLTFARNADELARAKAALQTLHQARWSAEGRPGVFASTRFRAFHDLVMPELLEKDALWVGTLDVRGEPIAAFYNIVWGGTSYFYQSGRRVDLPKNVRAGVVMHACLIRAAIEAGLREYDFLGGDARYKMDMALATRALVTLRAAKPSLAETARKTTELAIEQARWLRDNLRKVRRWQAA